MLEAGQPAYVAVAAATLWRSPASPRVVDAPALRTPTDIRGWVASLTADDRAYDGVLTQMLLGEPVIVDEVVDRWARVVAVQQPAARHDLRGYPGWMPVGQLTGDPAVPGLEMVVDATATALRDAPDGDVAIRGVAMATRLVMAAGEHQGWRPVVVPGRNQLAWMINRDLVPVPSQRPTSAQVLDIAARLLSVPYVWGGLSPYGIDCSGLVHLAHRRLGVTVPRDASDQAAALTPIALGTERPGDLYYFARPGRPVHHVGFVSAFPRGDGEGDRQMLHACYTAGQVVDEKLSGERYATLIGARRVVV
jgi:gamma-D-glutamyl-L-lysine dipeptidyl-peptidase